MERMTCIAITFLLACHQKAPPMDGQCVGIAPSSYKGETADGPTLRCSWRGHLWDCTESRSRPGVTWSCCNVGEAPAEHGPSMEARK